METFAASLALWAGNSPVPVNSPHKCQRRGALVFSFICVWINDWVSNRKAGDLRRHRGHYDVNVMWKNTDSVVLYVMNVSQLLLIIAMFVCYLWFMMTPSYGAAFRFNGHSCRESTGHRWITLIKWPVTRALLLFLCMPKQTVEEIVELPVIWDAMSLIMTSLKCQMQKRTTQTTVVSIWTICHCFFVKQYFKMTSKTNQLTNI